MEVNHDAVPDGQCGKITLTFKEIWSNTTNASSSRSLVVQLHILQNEHRRQIFFLNYTQNVSPFPIVKEVFITD